MRESLCDVCKEERRRLQAVRRSQRRWKDESYQTPPHIEKRILIYGARAALGLPLFGWKHDPWETQA